MRIGLLMGVGVVLAVLAAAGFGEAVLAQNDPAHKLAADLWAQGATAAQKQDYDGAIARFTEALRLVPDFVGALVDRGDAYLLTQAYEKAMADYDAAVRINPRDPGGHYGRGRVYYAKRDYARAVAAYNEAIKRNPNQAAFYNDRGMAYRKLKKYEAAIADYTQAIKLAPQQADAYYNRGNAYKANREYEKALADLGEAVRLNPSDAQAHNNLALLLASCPKEKLRDGKKAVGHATKACELTDWKNTDLLDTLATAYAEAGKFDLAVRWAKAAVKAAPDEDKAEIQGHVELFQAGRPYHAE